MEHMEVILKANHLSKRFGGLRAVDDVSFEVTRLGVTSIIGPNGAGKSTLFNLISGTFTADSGLVELGDLNLTRMSPEGRLSCGMARSFQITNLFFDLSVIDNLRIATRDEQEQNSKGIKPGTKRERKQSAKPLPYGITQDMMKKYVVYYHEWLNVEKSKSREFFKIEKHPKLNKIWIGTKSNKISISDKLLQANNMIVELDK